MPLLGRTRTLTAEFTAAGVLADPTTITLTITSPTGIVTTPVPAHDSVGVYHHDLVLNEAGTWIVEWDGTGSVPASATEEIIVTDPTHSGPSASPCATWIDWDDVDCDAAAQITDPVVQALILGFVTEVLWALSCQQFGLCSVTARPCRGQRGVWPVWGVSGAYGWAWDGWLPSGGYFGCGGCRARTGVELPGGPIAEVTQVKVDGVILDPSAYRVDEWHELVRLDGARWPTTQNLLLPDTEVGTWSVTWSYGVEVPAGGILAAKLYACEVAKGVNGDDCALPPGTTSASRDGVTVNIIDTAEAVATGKTGVLLTDMWLQTVCPGGPSKAMSGGMDPGRRRGRAVRTGT